VISRYLSPNEDRYRTRKIESLGSGPAFLSSFRSSFAPTQHVSLEDDVDAWVAVLPGVDVWVVELETCCGLTRVGVIDSMTPTRCPPIRTSLFLTSRAPLGTTTDTR
jgi:hypothetical protein